MREIKEGVEYTTLEGNKFTIRPETQDRDTVVRSIGGYIFRRDGDVWKAGMYCGFAHDPTMHEHVDWSLIPEDPEYTTQQLELF